MNGFRDFIGMRSLAKIKGTFILYISRKQVKTTLHLNYKNLKYSGINLIKYINVFCTEIHKIMLKEME